MNEEEKIEGNIDMDQALKEFEAQSALNPTNTTPSTSQISEIISEEVSGIKTNNEEKIRGKIDLNQALREFEEKSTLEQAPDASLNSKTSEISGDEESNIKFEIDNLKSAKLDTRDVPRMVGWVMKFSGGAIKKQKTAEYVLLGFAIAIFALSLFFFFKGDTIISGI